MIFHSRLYKDISKALKSTNYYVTSNGRLRINNIKKALLNNEPKVILKLTKTFSRDESLKTPFIHTIKDNDNKAIHYIDVTPLLQVLNEYPYINGNMTKYVDRIGLSYDNVNHEFINDNSNIVLNYPYKDCLIKAGMTKDDYYNRDIIEPFLNNIAFYSEINTLKEPKIFINATKYSYDNERHKVISRAENKFKHNFGDHKIDNLFVSGNNLEALYSLRSMYRNKVKLIYIDPPFNTHTDSFIYNDSFNHSAWLTFMKNRLTIARDFLSRDGMIFVNIDSHESAYLKVLMDEIFGRNNYINTITYKATSISGTKTQNKDKTILSETNYIHVYALNKKNIMQDKAITPQYISKNKWPTRTNKYLVDNKLSNPKIIPLKREYIKYRLRNVKNKKKRSKIIATTRIKQSSLFNKNFKHFVYTHLNKICRTARLTNSSILSHTRNDNKVHKICYKNKKIFTYNNSQLIFLKNSVHKVNGKYKIANLLGNLWADKDVGSNTNEHEGGIAFQDAKKPERLLKRIISMATFPGDIVMDFFAGSATTQAVAMKMNRKFIGVEQLDYPINKIDPKHAINKKDTTPIFIKRLKNVINGEMHGISKDNDVNWYAGKNNCSFIYVKLMNKNQAIINNIHKILKSSISNTKKKLNMLNKIYLKILFNKPFIVGNKGNSYKFFARIKVFADLLQVITNPSYSKLHNVKNLKRFFYGTNGILNKYSSNKHGIQMLKAIVKRNDSHKYLSKLIDNIKLFIIHNIQNESSTNNIKVVNNKLMKFEFSINNNKSIQNISLYIKPKDMECHFTNVKDCCNYLIGILNNNQDYVNEENIESNRISNELKSSDLKFNESFYDLKRDE